MDIYTGICLSQIFTLIVGYSRTKLDLVAIESLINLGFSLAKVSKHILH